MTALAVPVAVSAVQCSKPSSGDSADNNSDSTGTGTQKTVRQIVLADQSVNR
jgi:hypothetical protein